MSSCLPSSNSDISLRPAERADAALIHRMIGELSAFLGEAHKHEASIADYERFGFGAEACFDCVIADYKGAPVGLCLFFTSFSTWIGKPGVYVQDLYVSEAARGLGLGRILLSHVAHLGQARGCAYLRLSVDAANLSAQGFYEKSGLKWSESEKLYMARDGAFVALAEAGTQA